MLQVEPVAGAAEAHRQHAGSVDDLHRGVHREVAHRLAPGVRRLPLAHAGELQISEHALASIERLFQRLAHAAPLSIFLAYPTMVRPPFTLTTCPVM